MGQEPATIVYSNYLAARLGITIEHTRQQRLAMGYNARSSEGPAGSHLALAVVREELRRRGWN
jgi:hypothetical protein